MWKLRNILVNLEFCLFPIWRLRKSGAKIGKNVFLGKGVYVELENAKYLTIEDNVTISAYAKIILHDSSLQNVSNGKVLYGKVILREFVYIGADTLILPGTEIGNRTIVGAGSLVKGMLKSKSVYFGRPAVYKGSLETLQEKWRKRKPGLMTDLISKNIWYEKISD